MYRLLEFEKIGDERGWLTPVESYSDIPFLIKRIYFIHGTGEDIKRGMHAHKNLEQVIICLAGSCTLFLDNGFQNEEILLVDNNKGVYLKDLVWRELYNFSRNCILLVLASDHYYEGDYIRDYNSFKELVLKEDY